MTRWDQLREAAYLCGWSPSEFWTATMGDLVLATRAHAQARKEVKTLTAWHAVLMMNMVSKERITIEQLMPELRQQVVTFNPKQFGGDVDAMRRAIAAQQAAWDAEDDAATEGRSYFDG